MERGFVPVRRTKFLRPTVGVLQIGIRAWLQHLACLGSWTSRSKTIFRVLLRVMPYLSYFLKSLVKKFIEEKNETFYCVCEFNEFELCIVHILLANNNCFCQHSSSQ
jgi:hypothetical protein